MAWLTGWQYRIRFNIAPSDVDTTLTHFAVKVRLTSTQGEEVFARLGSDANRFKIAFTDTDGTTELYGCIEHYSDADEEAVFRVSKSTLSISQSANTTLCMYYDPDHADNTTYISDAGGTAAQSVYDSNTVMACLMANDPNGDTADAIKDCTSNNHDLTPNGSMTSADLVDGQAGGKAIDLDGSNDFLSADGSSDFNFGNGQFTFEFVFKFNALPGSGVNVNLLSLGTPGDSDLSYEIDIYNDGSNYLFRFVWSTDGTWQGNSAYKTVSLTADTWTYLAVTRSGSTVTFYQDGVSLGTSSIGSNVIPYSNSTDDLIVGAANGGSAELINAVIDEFCYSDTCRSTDWIECRDLNFSDDLISYWYDEESDGVIIDSGFSSVSTLTATVEPIAATVDASGGFSSTGSLSGDAGDMVLVTANDPRVFTFSLSAPGYSAVTIPISSFSTRIRSGDPTYLQVVIPGEDYADEIADRTTGGVMVLRMGFSRAGSIILTETVATVDLEDVSLEEGSKKKTITLTGHRTETFSAKTVTLAGASYQKTLNGALRVRCTPDLYLRPGDTAQVNDEEFTVDSISWSVSMASQKIRETYEISEAA